MLKAIKSETPINSMYSLIPTDKRNAFKRGYVGQKMFPVAKKFLCEHCRKGLEK